MKLSIGILTFFFFILPILLTISFFTLAERKVMSTIQRRKGPNVTGYGIMQPVADGIKLIIKEFNNPVLANNFIFVFSPFITLTFSIFGWCIIPFNHLFLFADVELSVLFFLAISSISIYGIVLAGWASNSKYAFLGALRSVAQMISYEISMGLILLPIGLITSSLNFYDITIYQINNSWLIFPLMPSAFFFFIVLLAETNRAPFDLPEAEAELVAGYNVEYSSVLFALFFLGEYNNIILSCAIFSICFLGGFAQPFIFSENPYGLQCFIEVCSLSIKTIFMCSLFIIVRALLPRYRYDQLMNIGWKVLLPLALSFFILVLSLIITLNKFIF